MQMQRNVVAGNIGFLRCPEGKTKSKRKNANKSRIKHNQRREVGPLDWVWVEPNRTKEGCELCSKTMNSRCQSIIIRLWEICGICFVVGRERGFLQLEKKRTE